MNDPDFREIERDRDDRLADEAGEASSAGGTECPNCGTTDPPRATVRGDITYFNCVECDFSTWSRGEYER